MPTPAEFPPLPAPVPRRGRPRTRTDEQIAQSRRDAVQRYRADGDRLDVKLTASACRKLDAWCSRNRASRRQVIEALIRIAHASEDLTPLTMMVEHVKEEEKA